MKSFFFPGVLFLSVVILGTLHAGDFSLEKIKDNNLKFALRTMGNVDFSAIKTLRLINSQIFDIRSLADMTQLTALDLFNNRITNIIPLGSLVNLTHLSLGKNRVTDLSPLTNLVNLEVLDINHNLIRDFRPLEVLRNLKELDIRGVNITIDSFQYWQFTNVLGIYDSRGIWYEIPPDEKTKWRLQDGEVLSVNL